MKIFRKLLYLDDGKGIEKGAPEKRAFFRFWEILWLKKYKLVAVNFMYFICNLIPMLLAAASYILSVSLYFTLTGKSMSVMNSPEGAHVYTIGLVFVTFFFTVIPIYSLGPCKAGFMYIIKSFVKREPCFIWHDYVTKTRSNAKLATKASIINGFIGFFIMIDTAFVMAITTPGAPLEQAFPGWVGFFSTLLLICLSVLFFTMMLYIYPMIVTFKLSLKQLYKNAMLFAFIKWLPNLGIVLLNVIMIAVPLIFIENLLASLLLCVVVYAVFGMGFMSLVNTSFTYPYLKRFMIDNYKADKSRTEEETSGEENKADEIRLDDGTIIPDWKPPVDTLEDLYGEDYDEVLTADDEDLEGEEDEG